MILGASFMAQIMRGPAQIDLLCDIQPNGNSKWHEARKTFE